MRILVALLFLGLIAEIISAQQYGRRGDTRRNNNDPVERPNNSGNTQPVSRPTSKSPTHYFKQPGSSKPSGSSRRRSTSSSIIVNKPRLGQQTRYQNNRKKNYETKRIGTRTHKTIIIKPIEHEIKRYTTTTERPEPSKPIIPPVPENKKPGNVSQPDDGCGSSSVRFKEDGKCYPLLKQGPCPSPGLWLTVDPYSLQGVCTPRLCGRNRVFVGRDELCYDINDPDGGCRGGRRLFYNAFGQELCDCPIGQYPFPSERDDCVPIFTQGPCPDDHVVTPSSSGQLECKPNFCSAPSSRESFDSLILQLVRVKKTDDDDDCDCECDDASRAPYDECYALGTRGPCCSSSDLLGYNIFKLESECVDVKDPSLPYFISEDEANLLDEYFDEPDGCNQCNECNQQTKCNSTESTSEQSHSSRIKRQGVISTSITSGTSLLNACQQGGRVASNLKCTNPLIPGTSTGFRPPVPPRCPPGTIYSAATRQCRRAK